MSVIVRTVQGGTNSYPTPAQDFNWLLNMYGKQGVIGSGDYQVNQQASPNMSVLLNAGNLVMAATPTSEALRYFGVNLSANATVNIASNTTGSTVYDVVYVELPAATLHNPPVSGDFTEAVALLTERHTSAGVALSATNAYPLAEITVANNATSILTANINDLRGAWDDGWNAVRDTWTYASATTITVPSNVTLKCSVGDKIKLIQAGTVKYFYVVGVTATLLTITGGSNYTLANSAITSNYYSHEVSPIGFPQWFNWTPGFTGFSSNPSGFTARFMVTGRVVILEYNSAGNGGTSNANSFTMTNLPVTSANNGQSAQFPVRVKDNSAWTTTPGAAILNANSTTITFYKDTQGNVFTTSGYKDTSFTIMYEI